MSWTRFQFGSDVHGDMQDQEACRVFFEFAKLWKPEIRICGGDLFDFRPLRKGASADEQRQSLLEDFSAGKKWFELFRPTHFLRGNHDERIYELAEHGCGVASDYAKDQIEKIDALVKHYKSKMLPYDKRGGVLRIGHLKLLHGFHAGVYAARQHALIYGSCLFGHTHTIDEHSIPGLERRVARGVGALCRLDMDYNSRQTSSLRHAHGFAYGVIDQRSGNYHVWQAERVGDKWLLPTDYVEL